MRFKASGIIKKALMCLLSAALGFACAWIFNPAGNENLVPAGGEVYSQEVFSAQQFRMERQQLRSMQKAQINDIIFGGASDAETIAAAQAQLLDVLKREEQENTLEGLLDMRGFSDAVVSIHKDSASVLVAKEMVTRQESALILDLVCRETGFLGGNIKIIPIK